MSFKLRRRDVEQGDGRRRQKDVGIERGEEEPFRKGNREKMYNRGKMKKKTMGRDGERRMESGW